jgi:pyridoxamine 5'-phosphate oxidase
VDLAVLRLQLMRTGLDEARAGRDPFALFQRWYEDAVQANLPLPGAMTLATVSETGAPNARAVILRGFDDRGFVFYTNYESRKSHELELNPLAHLVFVWLQLERQVRIAGLAAKVSDRESEEFYRSRPLEARLQEWASAQSRPVASRRDLEEALVDAKARFGDDPPRPPHFGGYRVIPNSFEFWQGRDDRLHDRLLFTRSGTDWSIQRLSP